MLRSAIPTRFQKAWGADASGAFIRTVPVASQIGIQDGAASFSTGFPPDNFSPLAAGGVPPFGQDVNGLEFATTSWDQWYQARGAIPFDSTFATAVGGYPQGAVLDSAVLLGAQWYSLLDNNLTDPDDPLTSAGWVRVGLPVGTPVGSLSSAAIPGFIPMNAVTIGNGSSNANFATASTLFLFCFNWLAFSNTQCPIFTSAGVPSTRGANAVADFNANKQLLLPDGRGLSFVGADTMGGTPSTYLAGVPFVSGNTTTPGSILGENLHALISAENGPHGHTYVDPTHDHTYSAPINTSPGAGGGTTFSLAPTGPLNTGARAVGITINSSGSGTAHNTVQRGMIVYWNQKL